LTRKKKKTFGAKEKRSIFAVLLRKIINMYAIVEIAGHQYKVQKDQQIYVNRLQDAEGSKVTFDKVLLTDDGKKVTVGAPAVEGVKITASVVQHLKGDKVIVFKKKRRKGYQKKNGFRAYLTELKIEKIG
jgi:large subunit ribosomal protein L21